MKNVEINSSQEDTPKRLYEGPARLVNEIMESNFEASNAVVSGSEVTTRVFGQEGIGWEKVRPAPAETAEGRLEQAEARRFGREMIKIVVTPDGDRHHKEKFPNEE